jgi:RimJ/RimL family protein N-acetyltransferase
MTGTELVRAERRDSGPLVSSAAGLYHCLRRQLYQSWVSYGLRRDLTQEHTTPKSQIPITVREFQERDITQLFGAPRRSASRKERLEVMHRLAHLAERIPTCFVAIDERTGSPCFMQWLMLADQNERIKSFFRGRFPALQTDEALLENAYTPPEYRGKGIMSAAMSLVAERARNFGCRYVITFVSKDNTASLKGCAKAGFYPYLIRRDSHTLFHLIRSRRYEALGGNSQG